jgi:hypothetical protein
MSTEELTRGFYQEYLKLRQELISAFHQNVVEADALYTEAMQAIQAGTSTQQADGGETAKQAKRTQPVRRAKVSSCADWEQALKDISEALGMIDDLPERAEDFGQSVQMKLDDMAGWIEENERVTPAQLDAIENMKAGLERWLDLRQERNANHARNSEAHHLG